MPNFYRDNADLRFYVERAIPWSDIHQASRRGPESLTDEEATGLHRELLEAIGDFVGNTVAPEVPAVDKEGVALVDGEVVHPPRLDGLIRQMNALELHKLCMPTELGGLDQPFMVYLLACEMFARADPAVMTHFSFHGGIAMALLSFSIREGSTTFAPDGTIASTRFRKEIDEIIHGRAWGSMDITEPDCGSDMARIRTRATQDADGQWRVSGQKIFITSGHGKYHVVIARTGRDASLPASKKQGELSGLDELGLFLVPAYEDGPAGRRRIAKLLRAEDKLGHHASATMVVDFEDAPAALIGEAGEGFGYMLHMMNSARVGVGLEGVGVLEAITRAAHAYAAERRSMGKTIDQHEMIADYLDEMRTDTIGLRALAMKCATHEELAQKLELRRAMDTSASSMDDARALKRHREHARALTPLLKFLSAEQAVLHARRCLQIHGGVGYTTDYPAEKLYRDAAVLPIYEGTSQIQALMVMKDQLGHAMKSAPDFVKREAESRWRASTARDPLERAAARLRVTGLAAIRSLITRVAANKLKALRGQPLASWPSALASGWDPKRDFSWALLHAERLTRILADGAVADVLLEQVKAYPELVDRRDVLEAHLERAEPRARYLLDEINGSGGRLLAKLARAKHRDEAAG